MELNRAHWDKQSIKEFLSYLQTLSKGAEKGEWEKRIVNTQMKCIAVPAPEIRKIDKAILKGNFMEFIDLWPWDNLSAAMITGGLICNIKDFDTLQKYLIAYADKIDNWALTDLVSLQIKSEDREKYFNFAKKLMKSDKPFTRRLGLRILFNYTKDLEFSDEIFGLLNGFYEETHYYVNMIVAWLVAELFVTQRENTLQFLNHHHLNRFTINKAISKCHDSYRVSQEDREMLKSYRA